MNFVINFFFEFLLEFVTIQGFIGFLFGYACHYIQTRKSRNNWLCHSCRKGHYIYDPKRVEDDPIFYENHRNGYFCDVCGKDAPYKWKP